MAEGGEVSPFCSTNRPHDKGCEYFAEGGDSLPEDYELVPEDAELSTNPDDYEVVEGGSDPDMPEGYELVNEPSESEPGIGEKIAAGVQGISRGLLGPLSVGLTENPGLPFQSDEVKRRLHAATSREAQAELERRNPGIQHAAQAATVIGSLFTGVGEAALIAEASEAMAGSKIIQTALQGGMLQASDEVSKWALGQEPADAVGAATSVGAATLFSGLLGGAANAAGLATKGGLKYLAETKLGEQAMSFLHGIAAAAKSTEPEVRQGISEIVGKTYGSGSQAFKDGTKFFDKLIAPGAGTIGAVSGYKDGGIEGALEGLIEGWAIGVATKKIGAPLARKYLAPTMMKMLSSGTVTGMADAFDHVANTAHGAKMINGAIDGLFKTTPMIGQQTISSYGSDRLRRDLDDFLGRGGTTQSLQESLYDMNAVSDEPHYESPSYAEGGEVHRPSKHKPLKDSLQPLLRPDDGVAIHYPAQNMLLSAARGRVSNYLMGLRPTPHEPKLPFDDEPDSRQKKKAYDRALDVAVAPMGVMHEIEKGTVEPEHIKHLNAMYPELAGLLQKKATEKIVKAQMDGKRPSYRVRQGLSLLLGAPLSSEMTPQAIQAAQAVFLKSAPPGPPPPQPSAGGSKSKLSKADQAFLTGPQAREKRSQRPS